MIKNKVSIERQINERLYQFIVPNDSPLNECLMIVDDVRRYILERISEAEKQAAESKVENMPIEDDVKVE
jgi:hypothetical protein